MRDGCCGLSRFDLHATDRVDHRRRTKGLAPTMEPTEPTPTVVADAIARIEGFLA